MEDYHINQIVEDIISDLSDRRGFNNVWYEIDEDIQNEIKEKWFTIIKAGIM
jgi:hypothetical protein